MECFEKHKKALERQLTEAVNIKNKPEEQSLNSKSEFHNQRIKRVSLENDIVQCSICGHKSRNNSENKDHVNKFHEKIKCDRCPYETFGKVSLKYHLKQHS